MTRRRLVRVLHGSADTIRSELEAMGYTEPRETDPVLADDLWIKLPDLAEDEVEAVRRRAEPRGGHLATPESLGSIDDVILRLARPELEELGRELASGDPPELRPLGQAILRALSGHRRTSHRLAHARGTLELPGTRLMGILNVTPDSFSDGGRYLDTEDAVARGLELARAGAAVVDVGGESTRPGADEVPAEEEKARVVDVIAALAGEIPAPISVDTKKAEVADAALSAGASIVNDVSGFRADPGMAAVVADHGAGALLMHMQGTPATMQEDPRYDDLLGEITAFLAEAAARAEAAGVSSDRIAVDPGIGFGKRQEHNLAILRRLDELRSLGYPVVVGPSRKSFIGNIVGRPPEGRLLGTAATVALATLRGASLVRVHDVARMQDVVRVTEAIEGS